MKYKILIFILLLGTSDYGFAQSPFYFKKIIGQPGLLFESGYSIIQLPNGSYALAGTREDQSGNVDCFIDRIDIYGNLISEVGIYDTSVSHFYQNLQLTNGGFIISGGYRTFNPLVQKHFIVKTDYNGDTLWTCIIPSSSLNSASFYIQNSFDKGYIFCGYQGGTSFMDSYVARIDSIGNILFDSVYVGIANDFANAVVSLSDSCFMVAGTESFLLGSGNAYLQKINAYGNTIWRQTYHDMSFDITDCRALKQTSDNGFILAGVSGDSPLSYHPLIIKSDSLGNLEWMNKLYENPNQLYFGDINSVFVLPDGDFVGCGSFYQDINALSLKMTLFKTDSMGELKWIRFFTPDWTNNVYAYDMDLTSDGGYIISGRRDTTNGADIFLVKTNCLGFTSRPEANFSVIWNGATATFYNLSLRTDTCVYYFGDGDSAVVNLTDTLPIVHQYLGSGPYQPYLLAYACGKIDTLFQTIYSGLDDVDGLIAKSFSIFPNPAQDKVTVSCIVPEFVSNVNLIFSDMTGLVMHSLELNADSRDQEIDISFLTPGSYQVILEHQQNNISYKKLIVIR